MKTETDVAKRNALIRDALVLTRDEVLNIPLHHQLRPVGDEEGRDHDAPRRRPAGGALYLGESGRVLSRSAAQPPWSFRQRP